MTHLAIMAWGANNRISKYAEFDTEAEAADHVTACAAGYPEAFTAERPNANVLDLLVDPDARTVSVSPRPAPPAPTLAERIDAAFPQTDHARVLLNVFTDFENRLRVQEGKSAVTKAQVRKALEAMLSP